MLTARTLAEAQVYLSLVVAADSTAPVAEPAAIEPGVNLAEGPDAWTLAAPSGDLTIPYASEDAARTVDARFGIGVSQLVDPAQWAVVATTYARRALTAEIGYSGGPGQERAEVELNWEFAADALEEALKFLPLDDVGEIPAENVWSEFGRDAVARNPDLIKRGKLLDDYEYYVGTLDDFRQLHGLS
jgi:hypothetical protein